MDYHCINVDTHFDSALFVLTFGDELRVVKIDKHVLDDIVPLQLRRIVVVDRPPILNGVSGTAKWSGLHQVGM